MSTFIIFYAPFIILIAAIVIGFIVAPMDRAVGKEEQNDGRP
ncbi:MULTISPECIES: cytochrome bd oxidase small subunit CydS [Sporosarcina]|uniref:NADH-quinone oxidoreductase subunit A n=1 Tax=Sporosarcina contaminans TaxID=633403 RepID=A0ABW3TS20_9BACL